jgi:hypothetical protein
VDAGTSSGLTFSYYLIDVKQYTSLIQSEVYEIPPPLSCSSVFCAHPTKSATTFEPRAGPGLLDYVTEPDKVGNQQGVLKAEWGDVFEPRLTKIMLRVFD